MDLSPEDEAALSEALGELPRPIVFASLTGSRLYGLASPGSDLDLRAAHQAPTRAFLGLGSPAEQAGEQRPIGGRVIDAVSFEIKKFLDLLLRGNGNVLEALFSPLTVVSGPEHARLQDLASRALCRRSARHYHGFARRHWSDARRGDGLGIKAALQAFRAVLTGLHLMREGVLVCELDRLGESFPLEELAPLIAARRAGSPKLWPDAKLGEALGRRLHRLLEQLDEARQTSALPEESPRGELEAFLIELRLRDLGA